MKFLFYINTLGSGGAERVISLLANEMAARGHDVTLVLSFHVAEEYPVDEGVHLYVLEASERHESKIKRNLSRIRKLRAVCRSEQPDVAISFMQEPNFRLLVATRGLNIKTVVSIRNDPRREYAGLLGAIVAKAIMPFADGYVFQTEDARRWFPESIQEKSTVIFNPVDCRFFNLRRGDQAKSGQRVMAVGRLVPQKNHALLISAFESIAAGFPSASLEIVGDGNLKGQLQEMISPELSSRIALTGRLDDVAEKLESTSVFVLSSDYEGLPNALMEALAAGVPSISSECPCGGPKLLIEHGVTGLLFPVGDKSRLAEELSRLLSDRSYAEALGSKARARSLQTFSSPKVFDAWEQYLSSML